MDERLGRDQFARSGYTVLAVPVQHRQDAGGRQYVDPSQQSGKALAALGVLASHAAPDVVVHVRQEDQHGVFGLLGLYPDNAAVRGNDIAGASRVLRRWRAVVLEHVARLGGHRYARAIPQSLDERLLVHCVVQVQDAFKMRLQGDAGTLLGQAVQDLKRLLRADVLADAQVEPESFELRELGVLLGQGHKIGAADDRLVDRQQRVSAGEGLRFPFVETVAYQRAKHYHELSVGKFHTHAGSQGAVLLHLTIEVPVQGSHGSPDGGRVFTQGVNKGATRKPSKQPLSFRRSCRSVWRRLRLLWQGGTIRIRGGAANAEFFADEVEELQEVGLVVQERPAELLGALLGLEGCPAALGIERQLVVDEAVEGDGEVVGVSVVSLLLAGLLGPVLDLASGGGLVLGRSPQTARGGGVQPADKVRDAAEVRAVPVVDHLVAAEEGEAGEVHVALFPAVLNGLVARNGQRGQLVVAARVHLGVEGAEPQERVHAEVVENGHQVLEADLGTRRATLNADAGKVVVAEVAVLQADVGGELAHSAVVHLHVHGDERDLGHGIVARTEADEFVAQGGHLAVVRDQRHRPYGLHLLGSQGVQLVVVARQGVQNVPALSHNFFVAAGVLAVQQRAQLGRYQAGQKVARSDLGATHELQDGRHAVSVALDLPGVFEEAGGDQLGELAGAQVAVAPDEIGAFAYPHEHPLRGAAVAGAPDGNPGPPLQLLPYGSAAVGEAVSAAALVRYGAKQAVVRVGNVPELEADEAGQGHKGVGDTAGQQRVPRVVADDGLPAGGEGEVGVDQEGQAVVGDGEHVVDVADGERFVQSDGPAQAGDGAGGRVYERYCRQLAQKREVHLAHLLEVGTESRDSGSHALLERQEHQSVGNSPVPLGEFGEHLGESRGAGERQAVPDEGKGVAPLLNVDPVRHDVLRVVLQLGVAGKHEVVPVGEDVGRVSHEENGLEAYAELADLAFAAANFGGFANVAKGTHVLLPEASLVVDDDDAFGGEQERDFRALHVVLVVVGVLQQFQLKVDAGVVEVLAEALD
ncbi:ribonuclease P, putative [Babesia caballi]|uniref:Ribonuclease P, putative n=1 Tax=Babesia caballi TaxID=5871 RepID=A0AAV4LUG4_BABCB|nr:ribonuclease P, putative [Babesia caballi]